MNLKIGGNSVGKIMYGGQEFGGATKLEPGTVLYVSERNTEGLKNVHLLSTTKKWENLNSINIETFSASKPIKHTYDGINISSDDFKNLDTEKEYGISTNKLTVSRSIVDGEYRLNVSGYSSIYTVVIRAI